MTDSNSNDYYQPQFVQQGWQCPICKTVYAPTVTECYRCKPENYKTVTNTGTEYDRP